MRVPIRRAPRASGPPTLHQPARRHPSAGTLWESAVTLHRAVGNQAFGSLVQRPENTGGTPVGGGALQLCLEVGSPEHPSEREAEWVADKVAQSSGPIPASGTTAGSGCAPACSGRKSPLPKSPPVRTDPSARGGSGLDVDRARLIERARAGAGRPLPHRTRSHFESHFGTDLSEVRIHTGSTAERSAAAIGAQAYTIGDDMVFGQGQFRPATSSGRRLLAHELTHVLQQRLSATAPHVQRMTIGSGPPPPLLQQRFDARAVPDEDRDRVEAAIERVREVAMDPEGFPSCHELFAEHCPSGEEGTLGDTFSSAVLWKGDREGSRAVAKVGGPDIVYTQSGYDPGARRLARTLVHELMHTCGLPRGETHHLADVAGQYCIGPPPGWTFAAGPAFGAELPYLLLSYRRFLFETASGRLQLTAGADFNMRLLGSLGSEEAGEIGSIMVGLRARTNLAWGGERFGGLTGRLEGGPSVARFAVRDADPELGAGYLLQSGVGAEFYVPGIPHREGATAVSVEALYRTVVPLNDRAKRIHALLGTVGLRF